MSSLDQHAGAAKHKGGDEEAKVLISDMRERTKDADEMISKLDKEFGAAVASSRRSFSELLDGLREENARMKRIVFQRQKDLEELETQSKSYEQGSDAIRRRAHREHEKMLDDITKASSEVDNAYSGATKKITDLRAVLSDLKGHFGGFAQLGDRLNNIRDELGAAEKEKDELTKKLGDLSNQLKAIAALDKFKAEEKAAEMDKVDRKLTETEQGIEHANASLEKIKKDMDEIGK
jgi:chromosome segregation ATPase